MTSRTDATEKRYGSAGAHRHAQGDIAFEGIEREIEEAALFDVASYDGSIVVRFTGSGQDKRPSYNHFLSFVAEIFAASG